MHMLYAERGWPEADNYSHNEEWSEGIKIKIWKIKKQRFSDSSINISEG